MPGPELAPIDPNANPNLITQVPPELQAGQLPQVEASAAAPVVEADPMGNRAVSMDQVLEMKQNIEAAPDAVPVAEQANTANNSEFGNLLDPNGDNGSVEAAAVRPPEATITTTQTEAERQAAIAAADRANRQAAGIEPRPLDLT